MAARFSKAPSPNAIDSSAIDLSARCSLTLFTVLISLSIAASPCAADDTIEFNRDIRPILASNCLTCHGPDEETREAGLRLDIREDALLELDSGVAAIVPGDPDDSELVYRVETDDESLRMPPFESGKQLNEEELDLIRRWIEGGASFAQHWAFVAPVKNEIPQVEVGHPTSNPIDAFVFKALAEKGLRPEPTADRYLLIRRVAIDLTGLPPTPEQVTKFLGDTSPLAYERMVDRFLASPAFGERWAATWLDLARYADSQGYAQDPPRTIWRYRDWVIDAINDNVPFDQFTVDQLAGDMMEDPSEAQRIATAFHRNTMTNSEGGTDDEEFRVAAVVDRVNTTLQVWMGMTAGCAQCHTHKYDPISQHEYFQLFDILNQTADADHPSDRPHVLSYSRSRAERIAQLDEEIRQLEEKIRLANEDAEAPEDVSWILPDEGVLLGRYVRVQMLGTNQFLHLAEVQVESDGANLALGGVASQSTTGFGGPAARAIDGNTDGDYQKQSVSHTAAEAAPWWEVELKEAASIDRIVIWNRTDAETANRLDYFRVIVFDGEHRPIWSREFKQVPNPSVEVPIAADFSELTAAERTTITELASEFSAPVSADDARLAELQKTRNELKPDIQTPVMEQLAVDKARQTFVHIRGDFRQAGDQVSAGVPAVFPPIPNEQAVDRLSFAKWLVARENPLTARVVVNRYWERLFGLGIVETSEDFGTQGQLPSHPELLDWLAVDLMENDWDTKRLLRMIVCSETYRQSSRVSEDKLAADPYNRLMSRGPRFRLSAEVIRDQALFVAGLLSDKMRGPSVQPPRPNLGLRAAFGGSTDWAPSPGEDRYRRGLYTSWRRTTPYPSMTTFDATSREVCTIRRIRTNTPLQALVTLNDPVFIEAAQAYARRVMMADLASDRERLVHAFKLTMIRPPTESETVSMESLLNRAKAQIAVDPESAIALATDPLGPLPEGMPAVDAAAWTLLCNVLLNLDEALARP